MNRVEVYLHWLGGAGGLAISLNWIIGVRGYAESGLFNTKIVPNGI